MKKIIVSIFTLCFVLLTSVFSFPCVKMLASAAAAPVTVYNLISTTPEYYDVAEMTYGVTAQEKELYTPFNTTLKTNCDGWSINPQENEYDEIDVTYSVLNSGEIDLSNKALFVWFYFSNINLHEFLEITLNTTSEKDIVFKVDALTLENILKKDNVDYEYGYSWNLLELPINEIGDFTITSITFKTYSTEQKEGGNFADINIFNVYIGESDANYINANIKQNYVEFGVKNPTQNRLNQLFVGDSYVLPSTISGGLSYAFYGKENLLTADGASWKVGVRYNGGDAKYYNLGASIPFEKEGTYIMYYECYFDGRQIMHSPMSILIEKFIGLYFENPSFSDLQIGKDYTFSYFISPSLTPTDDVLLEYSKEYLDAEVIDGGKVKVTVKKAGETTLKIKVSGTRAGVGESTEYTASAKIEIDSVQKDNFYIFEICAYVFLGAVGIAIIGFIIKSFVKARKFNVK